MTVKQVFNTSADLDFPNVLPTLDLDFANSKTLDPRITFTRSSGGSYVGADGLIKYAGVNEPRFDHDPVTGESLGLLIEESRTNLKLWSEQLANDFSGAAIMPFASNVILAPDGTQTGDGIIANSINSAHYCDKVLTSASGITAAQNICCSVFFRRGVGKEGQFYIYEESGNAAQVLRYNFDTNQLIFAVTAQYTSGGGATTGYGVIEYPNGWYRLWVAGYPNTTTTGRRVRIQITNQNGLATFVGDQISPYLYAWGVQVEVGSFPTSYIPTQASTRTRAADLAVITGKNFSDFYNQSEGTVYSEAKGVTVFDGITRRYWEITTGSASYRLLSGYPNSTQTRFLVVNNSTSADLAVFNQNLNSYTKSISTFKNNYYRTVSNGVVGQSDNFGNLPSIPVSELYLGNGGATPGLTLNGTIKRFTYFPKVLSNSQLQSLTS